MTNRPRRPPPSTLERAAVHSYRYAEWLTESDEVARWLLRDVLLALDLIRRQGTIDGAFTIPTRDLAELGNLALRLLRDLGLTPAARHKLGLWDEDVDDAYAQLLTLAGGGPSPRDAEE